MKKNRGADFTHFGSIPFIRQTYRKSLNQTQQKIIDIFKQRNLHTGLKLNNPNLFHLTISMLTLPHQAQRTKTQNVMEQCKQNLKQVMRNTKLTTDQIKYFTFNSRNKNAAKTVNVIYLDLKKDAQFQKLSKLTDFYIRTLLKQQIIVQQELRDMHIEYDHNKNMFSNKDPHITLFRCQNISENQDFIECYNKIKYLHLDQILQCDYVDISTRFNYDDTKFYTPLFRLTLNQQKKEQIMDEKVHTQKEKEVKYKQKYINNNQK